MTKHLGVSTSTVSAILEEINKILAENMGKEIIKIKGSYPWKEVYDETNGRKVYDKDEMLILLRKTVGNSFVFSDREFQMLDCPLWFAGKTKASGLSKTDSPNRTYVELYLSKKCDVAMLGMTIAEIVKEKDEEEEDIKQRMLLTAESEVNLFMQQLRNSGVEQSTFLHLVNSFNNMQDIAKATVIYSGIDDKNSLLNFFEYYAFAHKKRKIIECLHESGLIQNLSARAYPSAEEFASFDENRLRNVAGKLMAYLMDTQF